MNGKDLQGNSIQKLYPFAVQVLKLKPWKFTPPDMLFCVRLPGSATSAYIQVIGQAGQEPGILFFIGEESLHRLYSLGEDGDITEMRILALSYDEVVEDLPAQLRMQGLKTITDSNGQEVFPTFTSHIPGRIPWLINASEADELHQYLEQAIEVLKMKNAENFITLDESPGACLYRTSLMGQWVDSVETVPDDPRTSEVFEIPAALSKTLWRLPVHSHGFQAELFRLPVPFGQEGETGTFPYLLLLIDEKTGLATHELLTPYPTLRKMELSAPRILMEKLSELGLKPKHLTVPEEGKLHSLIKQMGAESLPFPVRTAIDPEPISGLFESFSDSMIRDAMASELNPVQELLSEVPESELFRFMRELEAETEDMEYRSEIISFLYDLRPEFPVILDIGRELYSAYDEEDLEDVITDYKGPRNITGTIIDSDAASFMISLDPPAVAPLAGRGKWKKREIIDLFNNSSLAKQSGKSYSTRSISSKRRDRIIDDIAELIEDLRDF